MTPMVSLSASSCIRKRFSFVKMVLRRMFAVLKAELLSLCSGTGSLPDNCSGWALLQHMLPLLPDLRKQPLIHDVPCLCRLDIPPTMSLFEKPVFELWSAVFPSLKTAVPHEMELKIESSPAMSAACAAALASRTLQDRVNKMPSLPVSITPSILSGLGMRAVTAKDPDYVAREEEQAAIIGAITSVMDGTSHESRRVLLLHGAPGLGKSLSATQALRSAQNDLEKNAARTHASQDVRLEIVRGRGAAVVDEDLVALGRNLGSIIGVISASPPHVVLAALRRSFAKSRYVLLIDDADQDGLARALEFLPVSHQRCAVIITSQSLTHDSVTQLLVSAGDATALHFHRQLQPFTHDECMQLMMKVCDKCEALLAKVDDLRAVFAEGLGRLPLAVRLFAEWSRVQFNLNMLPHADDIKDKMLIACKSAKEAADAKKQPFKKDQAEAQFRLDYDAATGRYTLAAIALLQKWTVMKNSVVLHADAKYSRGLLGTVRLALLQLDALPSDIKQASKQLLGLLALCPPEVPWSFFDGGIDNEAQLLVRGARVHVLGTSLEVISPVGERCRLKNSKFPHPNATLLSECVVDHCMIQIKKDGLSEASFVSIDEVDFSPHEKIIIDKGCKLQLRLRKFVPARHLEIQMKSNANEDIRGKTGFLSSHVCSDAGCEDAIAPKLNKKSDSDRRFRVKIGTRFTSEIEVRLGCIGLPPNVKFNEDQLGLFFYPEAPVSSVAYETETMGRVLQHHIHNKTVSVIFGCNTGLFLHILALCFCDKLQVS
jgi:hypothetical protein